MAAAAFIHPFLYTHIYRIYNKYDTTLIGFSLSLSSPPFPLVDDWLCVWMQKVSQELAKERERESDSKLNF